MQVKVKNSGELKRYVSKNISSNSWNSTVNKVGVLAKFVFNQALLYLFLKLINCFSYYKSFSRKCDKVYSPFVVNVLYATEAKIENDLTLTKCYEPF